MRRQAFLIGAAAPARWLHPGAWWAWAAGMALAASRTANPVLLLLLIAASALVVAARRPDTPWARAFGMLLRLGIVIVLVRLLLQLAFAPSTGATTLLAMPGATLPEWIGGVRIGGAITMESVLAGLCDGLRLAAIIICLGAANALASPSRLLKSLPAALYQLGVSVVVALTFTPALVADVARVREARHLRGRSSSGPRAVAGAAMPVLGGALERSVTLAAAMDSRGYGRTESRSRRWQGALLLAGLIAACIGAYALLTTGTPASLQAALLIASVLACLGAFVLAGRRATRTRYRPDPWWAPEWLVALAGAAAATAFMIVAARDPSAMAVPATWPQVPLLATLGIALGATPALTAPPTPGGTR